MIPRVLGFKGYVLCSWQIDHHRLLRYVDALTGDLSEEELNWQARSGHHSMWHHLWHTFLTHDYYFSGAFGIRPAWEEGAWKSKIDLSSMEAAFRHTGLVNDYVPRFAICDVPDSLVDELKAPPLDQFVAYAESMLKRCTDVLEKATEEDLGREIVIGGRPQPVAMRATNLSHVYRHFGMMEDLRGLIRGPGQGTASI